MTQLINSERNEPVAVEAGMSLEVGALPTGHRARASFVSRYTDQEAFHYPRAALGEAMLHGLAVLGRSLSCWAGFGGQCSARNSQMS